MAAGITVVREIPMSPWTMVCMRCLLGAPLLLAVGLWRGNRVLAKSRREAGLLILTGGLTALHWVTLFAAIIASTTGAAMVIFYTYPLMTAFIEAAVEKRRPRWLDLALCGLALGGVAILVDPNGIQGVGADAIFYGIISALFWSARNVLVRQTLHETSSGSIMMWSLAVGGVLLSPALFLENNPAAWEPHSWLKLLFLAFFVTAFCHSLFLAGLKFVSATLASQIGTIQIVAASLAGWLFWGEPITWRLVAGGILVTIVGIGAASLKKGSGLNRVELESSDERL
jgi:drug/metabolite transporter (DMT)-like permease